MQITLHPFLVTCIWAACGFPAKLFFICSEILRSSVRTPQWIKSIVLVSSVFHHKPRFLLSCSCSCFTTQPLNEFSLTSISPSSSFKEKHIFCTKYNKSTQTGVIEETYCSLPTENYSLKATKSSTPNTVQTVN